MRVGHASIEMTMRYAHLSPEVKERAVQVLDQPTPGEAQAAPQTSERHSGHVGHEEARQPLEIAGPVLWRRRESNPRPEAFHPSTLRV